MKFFYEETYKRFGGPCPGCGDRLEYDENHFGKCFNCLMGEEREKKRIQDAMEEADHAAQYDHYVAQQYEEHIKEKLRGEGG